MWQYITITCHWRIIWLHRWKLFIVFHHHTKFFWRQALRSWRYVFNWPRDFKKLRDLKARCLYGEGPLNVTHHSTKFGGYRHCERGDKMALILLGILPERMTEGSRNIIGKPPWRQMTILPSLFVRNNLVVDI